MRCQGVFGIVSCFALLFIDYRSLTEGSAAFASSYKREAVLVDATTESRGPLTFVDFSEDENQVDPEFCIIPLDRRTTLVIRDGAQSKGLYSFRDKVLVNRKD